MKNLLVTFFVLTLNVALAQTPTTVVAVVTANEDLSTLAQALEAAGLVETLAGDGPFTVFAPTNEAFAALPEGELERLLASPDELVQILNYHVVEGRVNSEAVAEFSDDSAPQQSFNTLQGESLNLAPRENTDEPIYVNDEAMITEADISAGNGVVHTIDTVLLPQAPAGGASGGTTTGGSPTGR